MSWWPSWGSGPPATADVASMLAPGLATSTEHHTPPAGGDDDAAVAAPSVEASAAEGLPHSAHHDPTVDHGSTWSHHWSPGHHEPHGIRRDCHVGPFGNHTFDSGHMGPAREDCQNNTWHHRHQRHHGHHGQHGRLIVVPHRGHHGYQGPPEGSQHQFFSTWNP